MKKERYGRRRGRVVKFLVSYSSPESGPVISVAADTQLYIRYIAKKLAEDSHTLIK